MGCMQHLSRAPHRACIPACMHICPLTLKEHACMHSSMCSLTAAGCPFHAPHRMMQRGCFFRAACMQASSSYAKHQPAQSEAGQAGQPPLPAQAPKADTPHPTSARRAFPYNHRSAAPPPLSSPLPSRLRVDRVRHAARLPACLPGVDYQHPLTSSTYCFFNILYEAVRSAIRQSREGGIRWLDMGPGRRCVQDGMMACKHISVQARCSHAQHANMRTLAYGAAVRPTALLYAALPCFAPQVRQGAQLGRRGAAHERVRARARQPRAVPPTHVHVLQATGAAE